MTQDLLLAGLENGVVREKCAGLLVFIVWNAYRRIFKSIFTTASAIDLSLNHIYLIITANGFNWNMI